MDTPSKRQTRRKTTEPAPASFEAARAASPRKKRPAPPWRATKTTPSVAPPPARESQISVPPVALGNDAEAEEARQAVRPVELVEDTATADFFSARVARGDEPLPAAARRDEPMEPEEPPRLPAKLGPAAAARRAALARVVAASVALCAVIGVSGLVAERSRVTVAAHAVAARPPAIELDLAAPAPDDDARADEADDSAPTTDIAEPAVDPSVAREAKIASQRALERFDLARSIEQGEASVTADPSDAEAWLILGAAYQARGDMTNMRRAFHECVARGKGARRLECAQFPH